MSGASPAPPGLAPMYGAPQTPTPVAVPQVNLRQRGLYIVPPILVTQEECIVTSSYEAAPPARPTYDSGAPQPAAPQPPPQQHHAAPMPGPHQVSSPFFIWCRTFCVELYICLAHQVQQPQPQQQQQHFQGYQQQPMYHQQGAQYHNPPAPQYHQMVS